MDLYFGAASALDKLDAKQGSIKGIIANLPEKHRKRAAALIIETLKYKNVLFEVIRASDLQKAERKKLTSPNLTLLLVHDLLFARGIQAGDGPIKQAILRHKTRLQAEFTKVKIRQGAKSVKDLAQESDARADQIPRFVRINTILWSSTEAVQHFISLGYDYGGDPLASPQAFKSDPYVPDLLWFHRSIAFNKDNLILEGKIILQDKASCFPPVVLSPPSRKTSHVIDATAAPGNKTTLLSSLMKGRGKLYAFERDRKRFGTLKKMIATARCSNVEALNEDFLSADPTDERFASVTHILLDPSCSGSGIVNRLDYLLGSGGDENDLAGQEERLQKLAAFQLSMIRHAMKFPMVQKIVYSTCSVHATENEEVVCRALAAPEALQGGFRLARRADVLPTWPRRGLSEHMQGRESEADSLVRCEPGVDHTNGFFVSCFMRNTSLVRNDDSHSPSASAGTPSRNSTSDNTAKKEQKGAEGASRVSSIKRPGAPSDGEDEFGVDVVEDEPVNKDTRLIDCGMAAETRRGGPEDGETRTKKKKKKKKKQKRARTTSE